MSETIKYRNQHIILLVISFCVSALVLLLFFETDTAKTQNKSSQLKVSPDLINVQSISSEALKDENGNSLGDAFIYIQGDNLYVTLTAAEEKQIETTRIRLTNHPSLSDKTSVNSQSFDYSSHEHQPLKIKEVVIPIDAIQENTHLISAVQTTSDLDGSQRITGSVVFHPQLIQAIIH